MYEWRKMTPEQREHALKLRKQKGYPWHSPPHRVGKTDYYHLHATCFEHKPIIGTTPERLSEFTERLLETMKQFLAIVFAWCVLPNHYHLLIKSTDILMLFKEIGKLHGRLSYLWNGEENCRGRKVWYNFRERYIRNQRHFWIVMNYIHHNPVHHGYVKHWQEWPFSSAMEFIEMVGREKAGEIWRKYPIKDYGKDWDDSKL